MDTMLREIGNIYRRRSHRMMNQVIEGLKRERVQILTFDHKRDGVTMLVKYAHGQISEVTIQAYPIQQLVMLKARGQLQTFKSHEEELIMFIRSESDKAVEKGVQIFLLELANKYWF